MKKLFAIAACGIILSAITPCASADVIYEAPDVFYDKNSKDITRPYGNRGRHYELTEKTAVYADPDGKKTGSLSEGVSPKIELYYTAKDGAEWGGYYDFKGEDTLLWIPLTGLEAIYDNYSFTEEHKDSIRPYSGEYDSLKTEGAIYLWEYPGSPVSDKMEEYPPDYGTYVSSLYTDENGGEWGYVNYIWGNYGWFYLTDPTDPNPAGVTEDVSAGAMTAESLYTEEADNSGFITAGILAVSAAAVSAAMIAVMKKKKAC